MAIIICIIFAPDKLEGRISEINKKIGNYIVKVLWITLHDPEDHRLRHNSIGLAKYLLWRCKETLMYHAIHWKDTIRKTQLPFLFVKQLSRSVLLHCTCSSRQRQCSSKSDITVISSKTRSGSESRCTGSWEIIRYFSYRFKIVIAHFRRL